MLHLFRRLTFRLLVLSFAIASAAPAAAATITGLTVAPAEAKTGTEVRATATGSGLCGAVNIDWGDGTAITYATETLPVTRAHVYQAAGTFTLQAQGHGNCDGHATARVTITAPPPPPPPPPASRLASIELSPPSAMPRTPVTITLQGSGTCRTSIDFGDGNSQDLNGQLPLTVRHTYAVAGSYAIVVLPIPSCGDRRTATLVVGDRPTAPQIIGIEVSSVQGARSRRSIKVTGGGSCAYTIDFGDGNSEGRNAALPDVVQHNYPAEGRYIVVATAAPPCRGVQRSTIVIGGEAGGQISQLDIRPRTAVVNQAINVTVRGEGTCRFTLDFGDGKSRAMTATLPHEFSYRYQEPGDYQMFVWTERPCEGEGMADARVRRQ